MISLRMFLFTLIFTMTTASLLTNVLAPSGAHDVFCNGARGMKELARFPDLGSCYNAAKVDSDCDITHGVAYAVQANDPTDTWRADRCTCVRKTCNGPWHATDRIFARYGDPFLDSPLVAPTDLIGITTVSNGEYLFGSNSLLKYDNIEFGGLSDMTVMWDMKTSNGFNTPQHGQQLNIFWYGNYVSCGWGFVIRRHDNANGQDMYTVGGAGNAYHSTRVFYDTVLPSDFDWSVYHTYRVVKEGAKITAYIDNYVFDLGNSMQTTVSTCPDKMKFGSWLARPGFGLDGATVKNVQFMYSAKYHSWEYFPNYCVSSDNVDLPQTQWIAGSNNRDACVSECIANDACSAIEWYDSAWGGSNCYIMIGDIPSTQGFVGVRWHDAECHVKPVIGAVLKECRWESNHDQNPNSADYMGWTCANDEILTGFGLSADQHDVTKVQCCKVGGHSSIKSNTCTYVESNHERAKCGNGNDHMVFSGAYDKRVAVNDAVTEILAGKCCEVECDAPWCAGGDWGVDKNNCQVISTASTQAQELVCPTGTIMTEVEDGLAGNAHGVQKVASVTCCALDMVAPPTRAPTAPPSTARPTSAPTRAPSTSMPSIAPTTVDDCLLALKDSSQLTDFQYLSNIDLCLPGCRSPRRTLESSQLTGRLLSESNSV